MYAFTTITQEMSSMTRNDSETKRTSAKGLFDWVQIGRVCRQIEQKTSSSLDQVNECLRVMDPAVIQYKDRPNIWKRFHLRYLELLAKSMGRGEETLPHSLQ
jgi:hypothetical protein